MRNAIDVQSTSTFTWRGEVFRIEIQEDLASTGQFNIFARIADHQHQIINGKRNAEIGLKTFRDHCIMLQSGSEQINQDAFGNVLVQYWDLLKSDIPVAKIYNEVEAAEGCGFFLVEIVPAPFYADWPKGAPLKTLSGMQRFFLRQLKEIFRKSYEAGIIPDLKPENLRVRSYGELTIIDLRERKISREYLDMSFKKMLCSFNCIEGDEIYNYLSPSTAL